MNDLPFSLQQCAFQLGMANRHILEALGAMNQRRLEQMKEHLTRARDHVELAVKASESTE